MATCKNWRENTSVMEILNIIDDVAQSLHDRIEHTFLPPAVKKILSDLRQDGKIQESDDFIENAMTVYREAENYLLKWTASLAEFRVKIPECNQIFQFRSFQFCFRFFNGWTLKRIQNIVTNSLKILSIIFRGKEWKLIMTKFLTKL